MNNKTIPINGVPYVACPYLSFGDYDNSCQVERANVRYILDTFKARVVYHADPDDYAAGRGDTWEIVETDTVYREGFRLSWYNAGKACPDYVLTGGYGDRSPTWAGMFVPRTRNAPRRVACDKGEARHVAFLAWLPFRYTSPGYRYGVACYNRAPWVLHGTGGHGWEYVWIRSDVRAMADILEGLEDYPVISEDLWSEMESDAENTYLDDFGYSEVTRAMAKTLADTYGLDGDDLEDVVTVARTRDMWSWEMLEDGPTGDGYGQITFSHESGGNTYIDAAKVAARFLAWDAFDNDPDGLHGLVARLVAWLEAAPSVDVPGEAAPLPYGDSNGPRSDVDADTWWFGRVRPCDLDTDSVTA